MRIEVIEHAFDPWQEVALHSVNVEDGKHGATAVFVGTMRDFNEESLISQMVLEHYEGMTQQHLFNLASEVTKKFELVDLLMLHRVGIVHPGDPIVLVAVWSAHRAQAFEACERIVEDLKSKAPFWKKETLVNGESRWVENNTASRETLYG